MSVTVQPGPVEGPSLVAERLIALRGSKERAQLRKRGSRALSAAPLPLYAIKLDQSAAVDRRSEQAAEIFGWRYIVEEGTVASTVDLVYSLGGGLRVNSVMRGSSAARLAEIAIIAEQELSCDIIYEARILDLTIVGLQALWMYNIEGSIVFDLRSSKSKGRPMEAFLAEAHERMRSRSAGALASDGDSAEDGG